MSNIFYHLYRFIKPYRVMAFILLGVVMMVALYFASNITLKENIADVIPQDEQVVEINEVFEGLNFNNRLVFHLYQPDSTGQNADKLIEVSDSIASSLQGNFKDLVADIVKEIPDRQMQVMYDYYYHNLPFYLLPEDYEDIASRLDNDGPSQAVKRVYKQLLSPMGALTKMLVKDPLGLASYPLRRMREQQFDSNFDLYQNHIVTVDRKHLIFFVQLSHPPNETSINAKLIEGIEDVRNRYATVFPDVKVEYFGPAAVAVANAQRIKKDIILTVTLALVALFVFISLFYRSFITFFVVVTPGVFGAAVAMAVLSIFRESVSAISLGVGSVLLGITIDYALHFFTHLKRGQDIKSLFADIATPLLMSSLTTASAFLSLIFLRSTALQDLGIFAGISVIGAVTYTLVFLPHMVRAGEVNKHRHPNIVERAVSWLAIYPFYQKRLVMAILIIITSISLFTWRSVSFENDMLKLNYMPADLKAYQHSINSISNFSTNNIYVASQGTNIAEALQENIHAYNKFVALKEDNRIRDFYTLNSVIPAPQLQAQRLASWKHFWEKHNMEILNNKLDSASLQLGFRPGTFSMFAETLNKKYTNISQEHLDDIISVVGKELVIHHDEDRVSILSTLALDSDEKPAVLEELSAIPGIIILDKSHLTNKLVTLLKEDFSNLVNISLIVVFLILLISYGRFELAIIAFVPVVLSWLWVLGLMGWLGLTFNIVNIIICTFIFGLGIDYSIFVMRGLTQQYAYDIDTLPSYKKSIILSMVTTLLGIGVLAFAGHPALKSIAFLAIIGIFSVVFITFTVEHILYDLLILRRKRKGLLPHTLTSMTLSVIAFTIFLIGCIILFVARQFFRIPWASTAKRKYIFHKLIAACCKLVINLMGNMDKTMVDTHHIDFDSPKVIISNHHSFIDILVLLLLSPKVVMVTNDWVYNSPLFGKAVQYADFIQASKGMEPQLDKIRKIIESGYSIIVYPEGTRSRSAQLGRFHKGAFFLAEHFKLPIQPILLHGTSYAMGRGDDFYLKSMEITLKFLPAIRPDDSSFGQDYREKTKTISKYFKNEYQKLRIEKENPGYFREYIFKNYIYKGPILEWYVKIKYWLEGKYQIFHELVPLNAKIVDLGCGYGAMAYALAVGSDKRQLFGVDYDSEKIQIAKNCPFKPDNIKFEHGDLIATDFGEADVYIISDVLHYLTREEQDAILNKTSALLSKGGKIIIRDGDASKKEKHKGTRLTEIFSTGSGFNKTRNKLNYISSEYIEDFALRNNYKLEIIEDSKQTSNTIFVLTHANHGDI